MIKKKWTIKIQAALYSILLFPHVRSSSLASLSPTLDTVYDYCRVLSAVIICVLFAIKIIRILKPKRALEDREKSMDFAMISIILYESTLIYSTIMNRGDLKSLLIDAASIISVCLLIKLMLDYGEYKCINIILAVYRVIVYINFITLILFPNGMYMDDMYFTENWFLGYKNYHILFVLPALVLTLIKATYNDGKGWMAKSDVIFYIVATYSTIYVDSSTGIVMLMVLLCFVFFPRLKRAFNARSYFFITSGLFFALVFQGLTNSFGNFIGYLFGKDATLSGRTSIWANALFYISQHPIWGYGVEEVNVIMPKFNWLVSHPHNEILWTIYRGGIIHFAAFMFFVSCVVQKLYKNKENRRAQWFAVMFFCFAMRWLDESTGESLLFPFIYLAYIFPYDGLRGSQNEN